MTARDRQHDAELLAGRRLAERPTGLRWGLRGMERALTDLLERDNPRFDRRQFAVTVNALSILSDPRMADLPAQVVVVEWHWRFAPQADAHAAALDLLKRAGYEVHADHIEPRTGTGLVWARRP